MWCRALIAAVGAVLPLSSYATYVALASAAAAGLVAAFVFAAATRVLGSRSWALLAAVAVALAPPLRGESLANLANLHWYLLYGGVLGDAASRVGRGSSDGLARRAARDVVVAAGGARVAGGVRGPPAWRLARGTGRRGGGRLG